LEPFFLNMPPVEEFEPDDVLALFSAFEEARGAKRARKRTARS
jgi:hypothetical protein